MCHQAPTLDNSRQGINTLFTGPLIGAAALLYGPRLIRKVGSEITELGQTRAYCVAMAAAVTVVVASQLGLPVSSTHIAVGGVFGVGLLREFLHRQHSNAIEYIRMHHTGADEAVVERFLDDFMHASLERKREMLDHLERHSAVAEFSKFERKQLRRMYREDPVKRSKVVKIVAAWLVTVPVSGVLGAMPYFMTFGRVNA